MPVISPAELSQHKTAEDLWIAIDGKVYDISPFVDEHPGGDDILLDHAGVDGTTAFHDVGHSNEAIDMLKTYLVGDYDPAAAPAPAEGSSAPPPGGSTETPSTATKAPPSPLLNLAVPALIIAAALYLRFA